MKIKILSAGHVCLDIVHSVSELPTADKKVKSNKLAVQLGGNAANVALAATKLGAKATVSCVLGSKYDLLGSIVQQLLRERNITLDALFLDKTDCPVSSVFVLPNGDRALSSYQPQAIVDAVHVCRTLYEHNIVMCDANRLPMVTETLLVANDLRIPTMLDVDCAIDDIFDLPKVNHVWFSNESWVKMNFTQKDLLHLQKHFGGIVGITDGPNPIRWMDADENLRIYQPPEVNAVNTLGAGDVFRASLAISLCSNNTVGEAIEIACLSACEHITNNTLTTIAV